MNAWETVRSPGAILLSLCCFVPLQGSRRNCDLLHKVRVRTFTNCWKPDACVEIHLIISRVGVIFCGASCHCTKDCYLLQEEKKNAVRRRADGLKACPCIDSLRLSRSVPQLQRSRRHCDLLQGADRFRGSMRCRRSEGLPMSKLCYT